MNKLTTLILLLLALGSGWWLWPGTQADAHVRGSADLGDDAQLAPGPASSPPDQGRAPSATSAVGDQDFIAEMQARFGPHLQRPHAQIKLLEQLMSYLMQHYPDDWQARVGEFLMRLFPENAALLEQRFLGLLNYNDWLRDHRQALLAMSPADRRSELWAIRRSTFGEAAEQIWAAELRNQQVQDSLMALDQDQTLKAQQKLDRYLASIEQAYEEQGEHLIQQRRTELLDRFVGLDSVQQELRALPAEQRRQTLRELRAGMGMEAAALERWSALDSNRDQAWQQGQGYMQQRAALMAEQASDFELAQLRERWFPEQAQIIAAEEAAGFFRYAGERRIGRE